MAINSLTITGKEGPAIAVTAKVYSNIRVFNLDCIAQLIHITKADGNREDIDISVATTMTVTISSGTYAIVIS